MSVTILNVIHLVSFCWIISRVFAPRNAWRPNYFDGSTAVVAFASYVAMLLSAIGSDLIAAFATTSSLEIFATVLGAVVAYIVLTWGSVKTRVKVYNLFE